MYKFVEPDVLPISDKVYQLQSDYSVRVILRHQMVEITSPKGQLTDLASIPRWVWTLSGLTPDGLYRGAAVIHDYIYSKHVKGTNYSRVGVALYEIKENFLDSTLWNLTRAECDSVFNQLIQQAGETGWKQWAMYHAVRTFGGFFW
jgi:Protein of unknown function (DUF1353)